MDDGLKQRLIGAIVLIAIAVIFLPSLFSGEHGRRLDTRTQIPPEPEVKELIIAEPQPVADMRQAPDPSSMYQLLEEDSPKVDEQEADTEKTSESNATVAAGDSLGDDVKEPLLAVERPALNEQSIPNAWAIQVGSFRERARADSFSERLKANNYKAFVRAVARDGRQTYRVLVGPKIDKSKALAAKAKLDATFKTESILVKFQP